MAEINPNRKLALMLLILRWFLFLVMFMWTISIFVSAETSVFQRIYEDFGLSRSLIGTIGSIQIVICIAFVIGAIKSVTYPLFFILQLLVVLSAYDNYMNLWEGENWVYLSLWPMLVGTYLLYMLKDQDQLLSGK